MRKKISIVESGYNITKLKNKSLINEYTKYKWMLVLSISVTTQTTCCYNCNNSTLYLTLISRAKGTGDDVVDFFITLNCR